MAPRTYTVVNSADTPLVTTAETVVATLPGVSTDRPGRTVRLSAHFQTTNGVGTTGLTARIRRDGLTGTQVGEANQVQIETAAGATEDHDLYTEDAVSGEIAGQTYVLTVQQTAASGNGNVLRATLTADVD